MLLPRVCSWDVGKASHTRTVAPKRFLWVGNYPLQGGSSVPGLSAHRHCPGWLWFILPKKSIAVYTYLAGTDPPAAWQCTRGAGLSAMAPGWQFSGIF